MLLIEKMWALVVFLLPLPLSAVQNFQNRLPAQLNRGQKRKREMRKMIAMQRLTGPSKS
jgi:hypothetical protein